MATSTLRIIDGQTVDWNPDNANAVLVKKDDGWWAIAPELIAPSKTSAAKVIPASVTFSEWAGTTGDVQDGILRVKGPCTRVTITDSERRGLTFEATLTTAQYAFIDPVTVQAWKGGADDWEPTGEMVPLDWPAAGPLILTPTSEGITLTVIGTGMTSASTITLRGRRWWL